MKRRSLNLRMNACLRCGGAAYLEDLDGEEWRCLQCGRTVPAPAEAKSKAAQAA
jgi:hypothetical protein